MRFGAEYRRRGVGGVLIAINITTLTSPPLSKESGLLANQTTKVPGSSFDPKVGVGPDGAQ